MIETKRIHGKAFAERLRHRIASEVTALQSGVQPGLAVVLVGEDNASNVLAAIDPAKDVDGFHVVNAGRLAVGLDALVPCTPLGCALLLKSECDDLGGMKAVIVGKPLAPILLT